MLCPGFLLQVKVVWHCLAVHWSFLEDCLSTVRQVYRDRWKKSCYSEIAGHWPVPLLADIAAWTVIIYDCQARQAFKSEPELPTWAWQAGKAKGSNCSGWLCTFYANKEYHQCPSSTEQGPGSLFKGSISNLIFKPCLGWYSLHLDHRNCDLASTTCSCCSAEHKLGFRCWTQVTQELAIEALFIDWCQKH